MFEILRVYIVVGIISLRCKRIEKFGEGRLVLGVVFFWILEEEGERLRNVFLIVFEVCFVGVLGVSKK